mmetsp:Transcript_21264/g.59155  ORF Transcript_21264/g.59155 Transcript_21264/m.59155 type:complete len:1247 (-) Transcript_21264:2159-5899(-)|eukprot:CAMPEP_0172374554 /NCGR_PEP_ID=MMETSP1060-20121228/56086_1 /TAXON_ID=37318 /ORGANISM="Pseudo-nitzschia pungens, Strain cf. cingulata" /LENGTH=1246 /DNA_ID=CAMNT_0013101255 /DNA_START=219 /DNA_END=3959 /DNA_ORIENTATION=-
MEAVDSDGDAAAMVSDRETPSKAAEAHDTLEHAGSTSNVSEVAGGLETDTVDVVSVGVTSATSESQVNDDASPVLIGDTSFAENTLHNAKSGEDNDTADSNDLDSDIKRSSISAAVGGSDESKLMDAVGKEESEMNHVITSENSMKTPIIAEVKTSSKSSGIEIVSASIESEESSGDTSKTTASNVAENNTESKEQQLEHGGHCPKSSNKEVALSSSKNTKTQYDAVAMETASNSSSQQQTTQLKTTRSLHMYSLSSLPIDSLHSIACYLKPIEWRNFGQCSKGSNKICKEIFRRVRMHGFRCATEVVTAWKCGQHADAKELCALYVSEGVPIYPHSLGHSYHTLIWRLSIEAKHLEEQQTQKQQTNNTDNSVGTSDRQTAESSTESSPAVDSFYNGRDDLRMREELILGSGKGDLTYLEEKAMYNMNQKTNESDAERIRRANWRRRTINVQGLPQAPFMPAPIPHFVANMEGAHNGLDPWHTVDRETSPRRGVTRSNSFSDNRYRAPNILLKVHRHLLDQHLLGRPGVDDGEGSMATPPVSLSADFFHPAFSFRPPEDTYRYRSNGARSLGRTTTGNSGLLPAFHHPSFGVNTGSDEETSGVRHAESIGSNFTDDSDSELETEMVFPRPNLMEPPNLNNADEMAAAGAALQPPAMIPPIPPMIPLGSRVTSPSVAMIPEMETMPQHVASHIGLLSKIDLDVYSASSKSLSAGDDGNTGRQLNQYLKTRFTAYHLCLERHIANNDSYGFDETVMDFWDEFFPQTANIQYYDKCTAVPRISRFEEFLTKPCPKAVGIIQCEIERVKLGPKKSMKGRFFPTYEYRLFIRHRPSDPMNDFLDTEIHPSDKTKRRDTVLMMAKTRCRKHTENSATVPKKGTNSYYLTLPVQDDVDLHYRSVNGMDNSETPSPNGVGSQTYSSQFSGFLARLGSNFYGTEFQIFTPFPVAMRRKSQSSLKKSMSTRRGTRAITSDLTSGDEVLSDGGRQPDSSRRRNRFKRRSLRGRNYNDENLSGPYQTHSSPLQLRRSRSGDAAPRRNRKVSAAESFDSKQLKPEHQSLFFEWEDGAITYTANLLGSRPRIMDVCIPKVNPDGVGMEWKRYLENCCEDHNPCSTTERMMNHLKQLQIDGNMDEDGRLTNPANFYDPEIFASDTQEYSPPGDYGLLTLQNRPPWWNVELGSFVLNFGGRVSVASVKNFQLCDRNDQDHIMLQFGRIEGRHAFTMDFRYPLTAVQAFAIAISSLQSKISFG